MGPCVVRGGGSTASLLVSLAVLAATSGPASAQRARRVADDTLTVAVLVDGSSPAYGGLAELITQEIRQVIGDDLPLVLLPAERTRGDFSAARAEALIAGAFADPEVDAVVALGPLLTTAVMARRALPKPVILPLVFDAAMMGLPRDRNRSGRDNLNYISGLDSLARDMRRLAEIAGRRPQTIVVDRHIAGAIRGYEGHAAAIARDLGVQARVVPVDATADAIIAALPADAGAVLLGGLPRLPLSELDRLLGELERRRLPSFSSMGPGWVERGVLATATPREDWIRRARRVALHVQRIHLGEKAADLPVVFEPRETLLLNMAVARAVGVSPSFALLTEARLVDDGSRPQAPTVTLPQVAAEAVARNLNLSAARARVRAGDADVAASRGRLYPQIQLGASARQLDPDVASALGPAERSVEWSVTASQLIYSEGAWTDLRVKQQLRRSLEQELHEQRLDIMLAAAHTYIGVLRARTLERIQRDNVQRTRSHLELAEVRSTIGVGRASEVYRWQSELANAQRQVILAVAQRNQAEIALNQLLHQPLERAFVPQELHPDAGGPAVLDPRVEPYVDDPASFRIFRSFMVEEGLGRAPELARLRQLIAASERGLEGQRRALWLPTVALVGGVSHTVWVDGEGQDPLPPFDVAGMSIELPFPERDRFTWQVGAELSLPLFEGTTRYAKIESNEQELVGLRDQLAELRTRIEQRVRSAMHQAGASRPGIELTRRAADAAAKNLELVRDAYRAGAVSVISLLDAQSQALSADLAASDAFYSFMLDFLSAQRAVGQFSFELEEGQRDAFFRRLADHAERARAREARP